MTTPGQYTLNIYKGATLDLTFTWKDSAGVLVNLTGYTARLQVRESVDAAAFLLELTTTLVSGSGIVLGGAAGTIQLVAPATSTDDYTWDEGVYDLELVSGAGVVTRLLQGPAKAWHEVTR